MLRTISMEGGFGTVLNRGEQDAGSILLVTLDRGQRPCIWERMPHRDGSRPFVVTLPFDEDNLGKSSVYLDRRTSQDPDLWVVELDIGNPERFVAKMLNRVDLV